MIDSLLFITMTLIFAFANCDEYKRMKVEDVTVDFFNETIFDESKFDLSVNYKPNGVNTVNIILDTIQDISDDFYIKLKVYGQAFGAYKVPTGISFDMDICHSSVTEYFFKQVFDELGWLNNCPPTKGQYQLIDYDISEAMQLPMPVPSGFRVLLDVEFYLKKSRSSLLKLKAYFKVV